MPEQLRKLIRSNQKLLYPLLIREAAYALLDVGRVHKNLGAQLGLLAVLQTCVGCGPKRPTISCRNECWPGVSVHV